MKYWKISAGRCADRAIQDYRRRISITAFLAGVFAGGGYQVESNREHGEGRSDIVVKDVRGGRVAVFEVKYARTAGQLDSACDAALRQQEKRGYASDYYNEN